MNIKKTKIIATIGPASNDAEILAKMSRAGMDVARINFSHEEGDSALPILKNIKTAEKISGKNIAILQDLSGPKIRTGEFENNKVFLKKGMVLEIFNKKVLGNEKQFSINYKNLLKDLKKGHRILLNDGKQELEVLKVGKNSLITKVVNGGMMRSRRGVNFPDSEISISALTKKDKEDVKFGIKHQVEFIAFSFVNNANDVKELRKILEKGKSKAMIISKIETPLALKNFDEILNESDAIMVARGDLAVEIGPHKVPRAQKDIIKKCNAVGKPVITATQMMDSMISSPVPTRAEVSDISNAVLDGTDAVTLSEETAMGKYPLRTVEIMSTVVSEVESTMDYDKFINRDYIYQLNNFIPVEDAVTRYAVKTANDLKAKMIIALTETGRTCKMISRYKPKQDIFVFSPNEITLRQSALSFGTNFGLLSNFKMITESTVGVKK